MSGRWRDRELDVRDRTDLRDTSRERARQERFSNSSDEKAEEKGAEQLRNDSRERKRQERFSAEEQEDARAIAQADKDADRERAATFQQLKNELRPERSKRESDRFAEGEALPERKRPRGGVSQTQGCKNWYNLADKQSI